MRDGSATETLSVPPDSRTSTEHGADTVIGPALPAAKKFAAVTPEAESETACTDAELASTVTVGEAARAAVAAASAPGSSRYA
ncbi:hypothetical protein KCH_08500 [Kitasatospora cheerisanensis KCTC 2395]|uniref:Uncharacterized protein n=1 Tax=Kitasatospora cheerisanensis KCTC 2395 TaxID=1348663 RepID=A0A066Z113_9ACTN|nr:hypothetical protein KCH_08500 [Kitasatospora cheerisanensis KCTC 2395]